MQSITAPIRRSVDCGAQTGIYPLSDQAQHSKKSTFGAAVPWLSGNTRKKGKHTRTVFILN